MLSDYAHTDLKNIRHVLLATGSPHHAARLFNSLLVCRVRNSLDKS